MKEEVEREEEKKQKSRIMRKLENSRIKEYVLIHKKGKRLN